MEIQKLFGVEGAKKAQGITVIIDIFRAATVSAYLLDKGAKRIIPVATKEQAFGYKKENPDSLLVGEERGYKIDGFDYGNSPYEIRNASNISNKVVIHRSSMGTQGIVNASKASEIIFGSFTTSSAIFKYISNKKDQPISIVAMDGDGSEDDLFADYLIALLTNKQLKPIDEIIGYMKNHPGAARFLDPNNHEFPEQDFHLCLELDTFDFVPLLQGDAIVKHAIV